MGCMGKKTVIDEDEMILEDETPELITNVQDVDKLVPTIFEYERMRATLNDALSNQFNNAEEYAYHMEQTTNFMENQIVWESKQEDIRHLIPKPLVFFRPYRNPNKPPRGRVIWERVHEFQLGIKSYQIKVNLTAPTLTFPDIEAHKPYYIVDKPSIDICYHFSKHNSHLGLKFLDLVAYNHPKFKHSLLSLSAALHLLVRHRRLSDAQVLLLRMVRKSGVTRVMVVDCLVDSYEKCGCGGASLLVVFDLLVRTYVQARKVREGVEAFRLVRSKGFCVMVNGCNSVLGGLVKVGWVDLAWEVYDEVVTSGVEVNCYTMNIMVNVICKEKKFDKVESFLAEFEGRGVLPDIVTYNTLINGYCRVGRTDEAFEVLKGMRVKGFEPGLYTYNAILNGVCRNGSVERGKEIVKEMVSIGLSPDVATYNTLLVECCRKCNIVEAERVFEEMLQKNVVPDFVTYSSLIGLFSRNANLDRALGYYKDMKSAGLVPDNVIYTILINGYCRHGVISEAMKMRDEMVNQGCVLDVVTYNTLIYGLCKNKMLHEADKLFYEMVERGIFPDFYTFTTLINGYSKEGNMNKALNLFDSMLQRNLKPDVVTYNTLVDAFCKEGDMEKANDLWNDMISKSRSPFEAVNFFKRMASYRVNPDSITYNTLIHGFLMEDEMDKAFDLVNQMESQGLLPDVVTYNVILDGFCRQGKVHEADLIYRKMIKKGLDPDRSTYISLINGHVSQENMQEAFRYHDQMLQRGFVPDDKL
nr:hypothetical protein [Tanacetum cinerariifolium]